MKNALLIKFNKISTLVLLSIWFILPVAHADGGISIQGTRIIYSQDAVKQSLQIRNSSSELSFLVQSWVEDDRGNKTKDFVVTPPLYLSKPGSDNVLRLINTAVGLPEDKETLYYFIAKAIPPINKEKAGNAVIHIAAASRIKLLVRPKGLKGSSADAYSLLIFQKQGEKLKITNPSPYYVTLTAIKIGDSTLSGIMIPPKNSIFTDVPDRNVSSITFSSINDYGGITKPLTVNIK